MLTRSALPYPKRGLSENWATSEQPPLFSRDELNCFVQNPLTKRLQGAQRVGLEKLVAGSTGSGKVQDLAVVTQAGKPIDYAIAENGSNQLFDTFEFRNDTGAQAPVYDLDTDRQNNVYVLNGNRGWSKYSAEGKEILSAQVPTTLSPDSVLRTIHVDDYGGVYVAVGHGGDQANAAVWRWVPYLDDNGDLQYAHLWTIELGAFIGDVTTFGGLLYLSCNDDERFLSKILVYSGLSSATPALEGGWEVPYPCKNFVVKRTGDVITSHEPFASRGLSPISTASTKRVTGSTPDDFEDNGDINIWARYRAVEISAGDLGGLDNDPRVYRWRDVSRKGQARHFYPASQNGTPPHYHERGPLHGLPAVFFDGVENMLQTLSNPSVLKENADMQLSALPQYQTAQFCIIAVITPVAEASMGTFIGYDQEAGTPYQWGITFNADEADTPTVSAGLVSARDEGSGGVPWGGNGNNPANGQFDVFTHSGAPSPPTIAPQAGILTMFCDGGLNPGGSTQAFFRWNGCPIDRAEGLAFEGQGPTYLGYHPQAAGRGYFHGWVHDILVIDRYDRATASSGCFSDHPGGTEAYAYPDIAHNGASDTVLEQLEGYMAREYGIGHLLDDGASYYQWWNPAAGPAAYVDSTFEHPYGDGSTALNKGETPWIGTSQANANRFQTTNAILAKWDGTTGMQRWIAADYGGSGYGISLFKLERPLAASDPDEVRFATMGPQQASPADTAQVRIFHDLGDDFLVSATLTLGSTDDFDDPFVRIATDDYRGFLGTGNVRLNAPNIYIPVHLDGSGSPAASMYVVAYNSVPSPTLAVNLIYQDEAATADSQFMHAVALPKRKVDYKDDLPLLFTVLADRRAESVFLGGSMVSADGITTGIPPFLKVGLVTVTHNTDAARSTIVLAVNNGDIKKLVGAAWTAPTGGTGALSSSSRLVNSTTLFGKVYFVDGGDGYKLYDPEMDAVEDWLAEDGEIPPRCRFIENYRGRIVLWGDPSDAHNWYMSAKDKPNDFNFAPPARTPSQAIAGNNPDLTGRIPGVINLFAPLSDDIAIIGTDSQIFRLRGDPLRDGQIDHVSKKYGTGIGKAWTQDPEGVMYVFLNYGGVMAINPYSGETKRLSVDRIEKRLQSIDFSTHYVEMEWNWYDEALHVYVMPFAQSGGSIVEHYMWERRVDAWHPFQHALQDLQPTATIVLDGDAQADRRLAVGAEDGYVRVWSEDAYDDDGTAIDSWFITGPLAPEAPDSDFEYRFQSWEIVLANDQSGGLFGIAASSEPEVVGPFRDFRIPPGRSYRIQDKVRGAYAYARFGNATVGERWAWEEAGYKWARAGRKRRRVTA